MNEQTSWLLVAVGITLILTPFALTKENLMQTEGFEGSLKGNFDEILTNGATITRQSQHFLTGSHAALVTNEGLETNEEGVLAKNYLDLPDAWFIIHFKFVTAPTQNAGDRLWLASIWGPQSYYSTHMYFGIKKVTDGSTYWLIAATVGQDTTDPRKPQPIIPEILSNAPVIIDTDWHELKLRWVTGTVGFGKAYLDGTEVVSTEPYDNTFLGNSMFFGVGLTNNGFAPYAVASIAFDDITISDTDTSGQVPMPELYGKTFYGIPLIILQILGAVLLIIGAIQLWKKKRGIATSLTARNTLALRFIFPSC